MPFSFLKRMAQLVFGAGLMLMGVGLTLVALLSLQDNVEKAIKGNSERLRAVQLRFLHPGYFVGAFNEFDVSGWFAGLAGSYDVDKGTRSYAVFSAFPLSKEGPHMFVSMALRTTGILTPVASTTTFGARGTICREKFTMRRCSLTGVGEPWCGFGSARLYSWALALAWCFWVLF